MCSNLCFGLVDNNITRHKCNYSGNNYYISLKENNHLFVRTFACCWPLGGHHVLQCNPVDLQKNVLSFLLLICLRPSSTEKNACHCFAHIKKYRKQCL